VNHSKPICIAHGLTHRYDDRVALGGVDVEVSPGEIVALLGPNGSGKTTLFRLLCTLLPIQTGSIIIGGVDASKNPLAVRGRIGIVFQSPSLDAKLTVEENLNCQAALYGIRGDELVQRRQECLRAVGMLDRRKEFCGKLSGGLKRRVEVAKGMLHRPSLLLLDEPSTGLDPSARLDLWTTIEQLASDGIGVLMTTHLIEEADKADRVIILSEGKIIAQGTPGSLRHEMGNGIVTVSARESSGVDAILSEHLGLDVQRIHGQYRIRTDSPATLIPVLIERLGDRAESISIGKPSLEDVFVAKTGQRFSI
jgi:ABC-2 type transport system ATP-binding protein